MTRKQELELLEFEYDEPPLLDCLYAVISNKKHESGYKKYKIYGVVRNGTKITYQKCLSECSDVINLEGLCEFSSVRIDSIETNLFRFFLISNSKKFKVTGRLSDFMVEIVKVNKDK